MVCRARTSQLPPHPDVVDGRERHNHTLEGLRRVGSLGNSRSRAKGEGSVGERQTYKGLHSLPLKGDKTEVKILLP